MVFDTSSRIKGDNDVKLKRKVKKFFLLDEEYGLCKRTVLSNVVNRESMRIGLLTYGMKDRLTGIGRYAMQLSYGVRSIAPDMEIVLLNPYPESLLPWYKDFPVISVPLLRRLPAVMSIGPFLLDHLAKRYSLDLVHDPCGIAPFLPTKRPHKVVTIHDAIPLKYPRLYPWLGRMLFRTQIPWSKWTAQQIITVSISAKDDLTKCARIPQELITVIYPGVDIPSDESLGILRWGPVPSDLDQQLVDSPYFLYVGAINPRKNIERIIEAMTVLCEEYPRLRLLVVGPNSLPPSGRDIVKYLGYVDQKTLDFLYVHALAVLVPSLYEGFGFPALEAMGRKSVAIVSNVSSLPEVTGDGAIQIDPYDTMVWVKAMAAVMNDIRYREAVALRGYEIAKTFSWEKTARQTADLYRQVTGQGRIRRGGTFRDTTANID